ncbi:16S rRNA pseudouridine(516) synthase [Alcanivorax sp. N3-2A]|nr:16S rRNA pseudouridine(516) synthase [Alcanivorax sp. N3-2A]|tara:strand:- start:4691 stop:5401 length:711 start_codon:yes stop_codon:yes gene_type:complete
MRLDRFLGQHRALGRRTVRRLLAAGRVTVDGRPVRDGHHPVDGFSRIVLDDEPLQGKQARYLMLHKPTGCVSATVDPRHPTVLDLIDGESDELHLAGRLDFNTTGLLLLTNDGHWSRRLTRPGGHWPKVYRVRTEDPIEDHYAATFAAGLHFRYEDLTTRPAVLETLGRYEARLTLSEGRYHHVKRLFGHFNNRVVALHRERIGPIVLDPALAPGQYRPLTDQEIHLCRQDPETPP